MDQRSVRPQAQSGLAQQLPMRPSHPFRGLPACSGLPRRPDGRAFAARMPERGCGGAPVRRRLWAARPYQRKRPRYCTGTVLGLYWAPSHGLGCSS